MRGKGTTGAIACALLAGAILPALAAGGLASGCATVSATVTEDHGVQGEFCPPDQPGDPGTPGGPDGPGDPDDGPGVGNPLGGVGDGLDPVGEVQDTLDDVEYGTTVCREVLRTENRDREPTRVAVCAHAEADAPTRWGDWGYSLADCEVEEREATDPSVHVGDGGVAACLLLEAEPGGLVDVDTDDCPEDDPSDPTVRIAWITVQVCPQQEIEQLREDLEDEHPDPDGPSGPGDEPDGGDDGDGEGDSAPDGPSLPSNDEGVYSRIRDAIGSYGDDDSSGDDNASGDGNSSHNGSSDHNGSSTGNSSSSHNGSAEGNSSAEDGGEGDDEDGTGDDEGPRSSLPPLPSNDQGVYSRVREARDSAKDTASSPNETLPADVDDERCPDDMLEDTTVHVAGWTFWVCVRDPTS